MKWETLKKIPADLIPGFTIDVDERDRSVKGITLLSNGKPVCRIFEEYSSVRAAVPAKPEMEKKFVIVGTHKGLAPVHAVYDSEFEAKQKLTEFNTLAGFPDDADFGLKIESIEVPAE